MHVPLHIHVLIQCMHLQALKANQIPPGAEALAARMPECMPEAHAWAARKRQRTADTSDMQKAAISNACEQPAAILGMVPCPPDVNMVPLVCATLMHGHYPLPT